MKHFLTYEIFHVKGYTLTTWNLIMCAVIILANIFIIRFISFAITKRFVRKGDAHGRRFTIIQLLKYILWTITLVMAIEALGFNITILLASSAALLVGLGIGMQNIFKDFMSGIVILLEGSVKVNDIVQIQDDVLKVRKISWRTSEVITREDKVVIVPNHKFTEENVINWTHNTTPTRFYVEVGVDYTSDITLVEQCLLKAVEGHEDIIHTDEYLPFVRFTNFGDSALMFQLLFWSDNLFRIENTMSAVRFEIARIFKENNITIPFMQVVIHQS